MKDIDICQQIKQLRTRKKMTIKELGNKTKLTQGYLSRIENSHNPPPIPTLLKIGEALGVHISYFFGGKIRKMTCLSQGTMKERKLSGTFLP